MSVNEIVKLGDPLLHQISEEVKKDELASLRPLFEKMHKLVLDFREKYGRGRAISAPQAGTLKRVICINTDKEYVLINPEITYRSDEMFEVWDDCMSFPEITVRLRRHRKIRVDFFDTNWQRVSWELEDDMSELIQHEYDHLEGILAIDYATGSRDMRYIG